MLRAIAALGALGVAAQCSAAGTAPHIVFMLVDDLGWNDLGFRGGNQVPTPNIDALANEGVELWNYYVNPVCSPTRASLMSGRSEIHTGIQWPYMPGLDVSGLNLSYPLLPQRLKAEFNYTRAYMVGKWHLGMKTRDYVPSARGFDRSLVYYTGVMDYWLKYDDLGYGVKALDLHKGGTDFGMRPGYDEPVNTSAGLYSSQQFGDTAAQWIKQHAADQGASSPMFLYLAFQGIHSANNKYVQAPNASLDRVGYISPSETCGQYAPAGACGDAARRKSVAAAVTAVDDAVGTVVSALAAAGMADNTLIVLSTDNGGPTDGQNANMANNAPLRGSKQTYFEGGVRGVGLVHGRMLRRTGYRNAGLMHVSDWMETLLGAAADATGVSEAERRRRVLAQLPGFPPPPPVAIGDGIDNWAMLRDGPDASPSARTEIVHVTQAAGSVLDAHALRSGELKLLWNPQGSKPHWYPAPGGTRGGSPPAYTVDCGGPAPPRMPPACTKKSPCLFNVTADPCEFRNLASQRPADVARLRARLAQYAATAVLPYENFGSHESDPAGNPSSFGGVWTPWMTVEQEAQSYPTNYSGPGPWASRA